MACLLLHLRLGCEASLAPVYTQYSTRQIIPVSRLKPNENQHVLSKHNVRKDMGTTCLGTCGNFGTSLLPCLPTVAKAGTQARQIELIGTSPQCASFAFELEKVATSFPLQLRNGKCHWPNTPPKHGMLTSRFSSISQCHVLASSCSKQNVARTVSAHEAPQKFAGILRQKNTPGRSTGPEKRFRNTGLGHLWPPEAGGQKPDGWLIDPFHLGLSNSGTYDPRMAARRSLTALRPATYPQEPTPRSSHCGRGRYRSAGVFPPALWAESGWLAEEQEQIWAKRRS